MNKNEKSRCPERKSLDGVGARLIARYEICIPGRRIILCGLEVLSFNIVLDIKSVFMPGLSLSEFLALESLNRTLVAVLDSILYDYCIEILTVFF